MAVASPIQRTPLDRLQGNWNLDDSPGALWADLIQRTLSPWQRNPLKFDPLRELLRRHFDEKAVRACHEIKAFVAATNVQSGKVRIFTREELSIDALLASACLPNVHDAVVIDGVPYWDGGFRGNPPIWPFIYNCDSRDVVLVEVDPPFREKVPQSNAEIADRLNEITFGGALMSEMRAIAFVQELVEKDAISGEFGQRLKQHARPFDRRPGLAGAAGRRQQVQHRAGLPRVPVRSRPQGGNLVAGLVVCSGRHAQHARHTRPFSVK